MIRLFIPSIQIHDKMIGKSLSFQSPPMKFNVTIDRDEDGVWIAECPSIPGCVSQGQTRAEALTNIQDAITACLQVRAERGMPLTIETHQVEVVA
jgi:predicted RNase H-like HicB family nuclease